MGEESIDKSTLSIGVAIRSLYQLIVHVDEETSECHILDYNKEIKNLRVDRAKTFNALCKAVYKNIHPEEREDFKTLIDVNKLHEELSYNISISKECRIRRSDSRYYWTKVIICNAKIEDSAQGRDYLFMLQDIHEHKEREQSELKALLSKLVTLENAYAALSLENMTDQLTGCYNRKGFSYFEAEIIDRAKRENLAVFICVLDLNGLKYLNDTFGHKAGDEAISVVSQALKISSPDGSMIIRTGGDEFLVLAVTADNKELSEEFSQTLNKELDEYNERNDNPFSVSASYGIVVAKLSDDTKSLDEYIELADQKMYSMKENTDPHKR